MTVRTALRFVLALNMVMFGVLHFAAERLFVQMMPPILPWPGALVMLSGVIEVLLGLALLPQQTRRLAGYGLAALFVAIFPANIYMAVDHVPMQGLPSWISQPSPTAVWLRLLLQPVFIFWALWVSQIVGQSPKPSAA